MERLFKSGIVTTLLGLLVILVALGMWAFGQTTQTEMGAVITVGLIFLRSKDSLIGLPAKDK